MNQFDVAATQTVAERLLARHQHQIRGLTDDELDKPLSIHILLHELALMEEAAPHTPDWWCVWGGSFQHVLWELTTFYTRLDEEDERIEAAWRRMRRLTAACMRVELSEV